MREKTQIEKKQETFADKVEHPIQTPGEQPKETGKFEQWIQPTQVVKEEEKIILKTLETEDLFNH